MNMDFSLRFSHSNSKETINLNTMHCLKFKYLECEVLKNTNYKKEYEIFSMRHSD